ncbi:MAG: hypothetical protein ACKO81_09850 [Planctomycetota bacterium]
MLIVFNSIVDLGAMSVTNPGIITHPEKAISWVINIACQVLLFTGEFIG